CAILADRAFALTARVALRYPDRLPRTASSTAGGFGRHRRGGVVFAVAAHQPNLAQDALAPSAFTRGVQGHPINLAGPVRGLRRGLWLRSRSAPRAMAPTGGLPWVLKGLQMELTGAEIVVRCLQEEGVEHLFGYPGGAVLYIYDEIYKQDKVQHILVRHEQAAVHAADAYSRSTEKVGVCLVTSGPGVTNAVTGLATASLASIPMVTLSGQVPTHALGEDAFQECDTVGITRPCVKHNFLVKDVRELATTIKKAFHIAAS